MKDGANGDVATLRPTAGITYGMREADWPVTADGVRTLLRHMDEATSEDGEPIEFAWDWPAWDQCQEDAARSSWDQAEKLF